VITLTFISSSSDILMIDAVGLKLYHTITEYHDPI
jgi:hypothetical protein